MSFTINKLLNLPEFAGCTIVAGKKGVNRVIRCVDTMEIPNLETWIQPGELLLTTGYSLIGHPNQLMLLLKAMCKNISAGLAIKTRFIGPLPQEVLVYAEQNDFPIIQVPDAVPFIPLITAIGNCIADEQNAALALSLDMSKQLSAIQNSDNFFQDVAQILNHYFGHPVIIADLMLDIYASYPENTELPQAVFETETLTQRMHSKSNILFYCPADGKDDNFLIHLIRVQNIIAGYIIIFLENQTQYAISDGDSIIINYAANTLSIHFSQDDLLNSDIEKRNSSFYSDLIHNVFTGRESEAARLAAQRKWPTPPFYLISVALADAPPRHNSDSRNLYRQIVWSVKSILSKSGMNYSIILRDKSIRCLTSNIDYEKLLETLTAIRKHIKDEYDWNTIITISDVIYSFNELSSTEEDIVSLLRIARSKNLNIIFSRDYLLNIALLDFSTNRHCKAFTADILGKLEQYDADNRTNLLHVLQVLTENRGVQTQPAKALFVHRNTLLYQIRKIESLTNLNLSVGEDLFAAQLALKIRELSQID